MVELNFDLMKTIKSLQADLQSFKDDNINERKNKKEINKSLLRNMMGVNSHGQPTHSTNNSKEVYHLKRMRSPREEGREENTPKLIERDYHSLSSYNSLFPCRKR